MWLYHMFVDDVFLMLLFIKNTRDYLRGFIISSGGSRNDFLRRGVGISKTYFRYFCYTCKFLGVGDYGQFSFLIRSAHIKLIWFMLFWNFHLKIKYRIQNYINYFINITCYAHYGILPRLTSSQKYETYMVSSGTPCPLYCPKYAEPFVKRSFDYYEYFSTSFWGFHS